MLDHLRMTGVVLLIGDSLSAVQNFSRNGLHFGYDADIYLSGCTCRERDRGQFSESLNSRLTKGSV